jgi:hypothetical protein
MIIDMNIITYIFQFVNSFKKTGGFCTKWLKELSFPGRFCGRLDNI